MIALAQSTGGIMNNMTRQTLRYGMNRARMFHADRIHWLVWTRNHSYMPTVRTALLIVKG